MNEPEPKSILASLSGKPTTASNTGSPTERKTRTILVARTIADEPVKATPTAPCGDGHNSTTAFIVNQHHSRDARSGKLASYAALGGAEDVERFDQFLAEQRGQPSASELRAATTSPHHVAASLKRKTMGHVQLEGIDGKLHDTCQPAGTDAATLKLIQQELENDALKRREQVVGNRKWLNSLPIHERVAQQRQQNALRKWRQMSCDWETFKAQAARRLGKAPQELVMSRTSAYREQREMYDVLQKARPLNDKVGEDVWLVSLRNEGTRYVPVGNIFSGLFCPIRESTKLGPRVRRPLDYQEHRLHDTSRPMSKLEKRSLDLLARKKWRLRRQLELLEPHEVDRSSTSHLVVQTTDLFAWASGATNEPNIDDEDNAFVGAFSAGVDETPHGQRHCSNAEPISPMPTTKEENQFMGPSLQITHVADGDEVLGSIPENDGILVGNSPEVCILPLRLSFYTVVGEQEQRSVAITNDGNTIVHYQWWRAPFEDGNAELTMHMRGHRTRKEEQELERLWTTSVSKLWGTLLPQETKQFVFTFESSKAGMFLERWLLDADPQPRIRLGMAGVDPDPDTESSVDLPLEVRLSCVAEDNFVGWSKRKIQLASIDEKESHFFVTNLVDEILDGVRPPEPVVFNELTPREDVTKFYELNGSNEFSDVYFSPDLVRDCHALYQHAQGILKALSSVPVPVVEERKRKVEDVTSDVEKPKEIVPVEQDDSAGDLGRDTEMQQETPKSSPTPTYLVDEWNWRLETLRELCKMADEAQNTQVARLIQQLKMEIDKVEEEEENEEDDEDDEAEEEEKDEEEEEEEDEGMENGDCNVEKSPTLCPRNPTPLPTRVHDYKSECVKELEHYAAKHQ
ncbi:hypothetical protein PHMEG_00022540 [Phytophthora megakarya]|uniref:MYCBP-associated protein n=1 Tax=Phytophthora megakarya TaxID=4795 RepID=A0A225VIH0_9STRA|nr:hypothetical protein PHMEG_00022540 [Phytophthora megakarya]